MPGRSGGRAGLTVLLTNHALPRQPIAAQTVRVELTDAPPPRSVTLERIDDDHANAKAAWLRMGAPEYLSAAEVERLEGASRLTGEPRAWEHEERTLTLRLTVDLPPHSVAALTVELCAGVSEAVAGKPCPNQRGSWATCASS